MLVSIVIPAYNEENAIQEHLEEIVKFSESQPWNSEILVVDDGSKDQTADRVRQSAAKFSSVRLISLAQNSGKGCAVRTGLLAAKGDICGFTDADGSTPIAELIRVLEAFEKEGCDVVIGSRAKPSEETKVEAQWHRILMGRVFNFVLKVCLGLKDIQGKSLQDTQCGFKWFSRPFCQAVFKQMKIDGFAFDVEALYLVGRLKGKIVEMPVNWADRGETRVNLFFDPIKMLCQSLLIPLRHMKVSS